MGEEEMEVGRRKEERRDRKGEQQMEREREQGGKKGKGQQGREGESKPKRTQGQENRQNRQKQQGVTKKKRSRNEREQSSVSPHSDSVGQYEISEYLIAIYGLLPALFSCLNSKLLNDQNGIIFIFHFLVTRALPNSTMHVSE